jgi:SH3 domain-containing YSC84-like protein 1
MTSSRTVIASITALLTAATAYAALSKDEIKLLNAATTVVSDIRNAPDSGIPDGIWSKAECVVVIPSLKKAAFIVGGEFGAGVMSCKQANTWGAPVFMRLAKGSAGFQAGASSTELVLLVMNRSGAEKLLSNKVTLGADASVAAGPVGRTAGAATDAQMTAQMLSYSRAKGIFAGVNLSGGSLSPDGSANAHAYGANASAKDIALGTTPVTMATEARGFTDALGRDVRGTTGVR